MYRCSSCKNACLYTYSHLCRKYECVNPIILAYKILSTSYLLQSAHCQPSLFPLFPHLSYTFIIYYTFILFPLLPINPYSPQPIHANLSIIVHTDRLRNGYYYTHFPLFVNPRPYALPIHTSHPINPCSYWEWVLLYHISLICQLPHPQFLQIVTIKIP